MLLRRPLHMALVVATLSFIGFSPALSRLWHSSLDKSATDYAMIYDGRTGGEMVVILWLVPLMINAGYGEAEQLAAALQKYVVIMAVHNQLDKTTGNVSFEEIDTLQARDGTGQSLTFVAKSDVPPVIAGVLARFESGLRQSLGDRGKGMKMFVFDAGSVNCCKKGRLSVPFAGETYTWDTPFPGC